MELRAGTRPPGRAPGPLAARVPPLVECVAVLAAIALLLPAFAEVAGLGGGRDDRFRAEPGFAVAALPEPVLPELCALRDEADASVRGALCDATGRASATTPATTSTLPAVLPQRLQRINEAFVLPLQQSELRLQRLRLQAEQGPEGEPPLAHAASALEADIQPYLDRFGMSRSGAAGPLPLRCAGRWIDAAWAEVGPHDVPGRMAATRANAALLLGAALDGVAGTEAIAAAASLPGVRGTASGCPPGAVATLAATASLMADARQSVSNARKNEAMRELLRSAGWQWAGAMALGYALLVWSRRAVAPSLGIGVSLAVWSAAAWVARVPWPLTANREFEPARLEASMASPPAAFVLWLAAAAALLIGASLLRGRSAGSRGGPVQSMSSRGGMAGLVLATGVGWLLLLELSSQGLHGNRYLALYHQGHLWLGMLMLTLLLFVRQPMSRGLAWMLSVGGEAAHRLSQRIGHAGALAALLLLTLGALAAFGLALSNLRQLTSELGRVWLIVGAAWFFFLRAGPLTERLARQGPLAASFLRYAWPLLFVVGVLALAMLITRDMGPLLIAAYAAGAFLAATLAMWWQQRSGQRFGAFALAIVVFAAWIGGTTFLLLNAGSLDAVTASRLESMAAPFASINDQLALVSWFRDAAPAGGFGIGTTPWCGFVAGGACSGVPAQVHSDYTFTAIVGLFGASAAWAAAVGTALWLHRLVRHHGRVTRGEPRLIAFGGQIGHDGQALVSWLAIAWVVLTSCQLAVTVAGNLAVLPLTGVTFPFVSFGMTSLLVNMAFLGLCLNVDVPSRGEAHG